MLIDARAQKYSVIKLFIKNELLQVDKEQGEIVTIHNDIVSEQMKAIVSKCSPMVYIRMPSRIGKNFLIKRGKYYWDSIYKILDKHFKSSESYIPAVIALQLLQHYKDKGYSDFKEFDLVLMLEEFEKFKIDDKEHRALINKHFRCAIDIAERLDILKYKGNK